MPDAMLDDGRQGVGCSQDAVPVLFTLLPLCVCLVQWPSVKVALHAGEFQYDLVSEDNLRFHVKEAVRTAGAKRVGHGVALPWEYDSASTLDFMRTNDVSSVRVHPMPIGLHRSCTVVLIKFESTRA